MGLFGVRPAGSFREVFGTVYVLCEGRISYKELYIYIYSVNTTLFETLRALRRGELFVPR